MDEQIARLKRVIMERRGRAAAPAVTAPICTATEQSTTPRSRCSGIFNVSVCMEEIIEGKMELELEELESSPAGTRLEAPGQ